MANVNDELTNTLKNTTKVYALAHTDSVTSTDSETFTI